MPLGSPPRTGLVLGKFMPPHRGHVLLVDFARRFVDELTVVVGSLSAEPIPGELRAAWLRELFPAVRVVHLTDENPQDPSEHPAFWDIWRTSLLRVLPAPPQLVFASEAYGPRLAHELGARFVPVDRHRELFSVSGTQVRADPRRYWDLLPACVRPYFVKRVRVFGPESTGKTTLARALADRYSTQMVPEYARTLLEERGTALGAEDLADIARGQAALEDALAPSAQGLLVCDTDVLTTTLWSQAILGEAPGWMRELARARRYDLTLVTDVDVPWVQDGARFFPDERPAFLARCTRALDEDGSPYVLLSGGPQARLRRASELVDALLAATAPR